MTDSDSDLYLALDQGGHASRAIVFNADGEQCYSFYREIETVQRGDFVEHDALAFVQSMRDVLDELARTLTDKELCSIRSAGLATQRSSIVCWRRTNSELLSPVISWQDLRTRNALGQFQHAEALIKNKTGLMLNAHYGATKMHWCLENMPELKQASLDGDLVMAPVVSLLVYHLVDNRPLFVDPANAGRTLLYNFRTRTWDDELLSLFGIDKKCLPECVSTRYEFGDISVGDVKIPLRLCTGDQSAAIFAFGMPEPDVLYCNAGTGAFLQQVFEGDIEDDTSGLLRSVVYSDSHQTLLVREGTVNGAARALQWYAEHTGISDFAALLNESPESAPLFINSVAGLGSPLWRPDIQPQFIGDMNDAQAAFYAVLESIVFLMFLNITCFKDLSKVVLSGGLSNNVLFCQMLADLAELPVETVDVPEATARGVWQLLTRTDANTRVLRQFKVHKNARLAHRYRQWYRALEGLLS